MDMCMLMCTHLAHIYHMCSEWSEDNLRIYLFPSTTWFLGIELLSSGLGADTFTCLAILLTLRL